MRTRRSRPGADCWHPDEPMQTVIKVACILVSAALALTTPVSAELDQNPSQAVKLAYNRSREHSTKPKANESLALQRRVRAAGQVELDTERNLVDDNNYDNAGEINPASDVESETVKLLARYYHLRGCSNESDCAGLRQQANNNSGGRASDNLSSGGDSPPIALSLPRPTNLSVLILSYYPPILELRWNLNELDQPYSLDRLDDFYGDANSINETQASDEGSSLALKESKLRQSLINKSLSCFRVTYRITNSRFKVTEEYPPYLRSITLERLLPATEYALRVTAVYLGKYGASSERVQFISPTDNESRRFKENTYRPIHRYPDEKKPPKVGLEQVRNEELTIVAIAICFWFATIYWFFNKWGKIRMLEPYQPAYRETSADPFIHHSASLHNLSQTGATGAIVCPGPGQPVPSANGAGPSPAVGGALPVDGVVSPFGPTGPPQQVVPPSGPQAAAGYFRASDEQSTEQMVLGQQSPYLQPQQQQHLAETGVIPKLAKTGALRGSVQDELLCVGQATVRRASRSLLLLGQRRYETMTDDFPASSSGAGAARVRSDPLTMNYLFQKKAQTLARATTLWSRRQNQLNQFRATCLGPTAAANELELLARATSPSGSAAGGAGGLRCRNRATAAAAAANGGQTSLGPLGGQFSADLRSTLSARQALMRLVHARTLTVDSTDSQSSNSKPAVGVLRHQQATSCPSNEHDRSSRSSTCSAAGQIASRQTTNRASSCEHELEPANKPAEFSNNNNNNNNNKMRRLLFMNRSHQNHQVAAGSSSSLTCVQSGQVGPRQQHQQHQQPQPQQLVPLSATMATSTRYRPVINNAQSLDYERSVSPADSTAGGLIRHSISGSPRSLACEGLVDEGEMFGGGQTSGPSPTTATKAATEHHILIQPPSPPPAPTTSSPKGCKCNCEPQRTRETKQTDTDRSAGGTGARSRQSDCDTAQADDISPQLSASNSSASMRKPSVSRARCSPSAGSSLSSASSLELAAASARPSGNSQAIGASWAFCESQQAMAESGQRDTTTIGRALAQVTGSQAATLEGPTASGFKSIQVDRGEGDAGGLARGKLDACKWQQSDGERRNQPQALDFGQSGRPSQPEICLEEVPLQTITTTTTTREEQERLDRDASLTAFERLLRFERQNQLGMQHLGSAGYNSSTGYYATDSGLYEPFPSCLRSRSDFGLHDQGQQQLCLALQQQQQRQQQLTGNDDFQDDHGGPERPRMSSMFVGVPGVAHSSLHRDSFAMLRTLSQKKSKSAEDVANLSNLVLQIWVSQEQNPLLQSVHHHHQPSRQKLDHQDKS